MKTEKQCYASLGLEPHASDEEVKSAYRNAAKTYHPDKNKEPGAKEKFIEIQQAYDSITNKNFSKEREYFQRQDFNGSDLDFNFNGFGFPGFGSFDGFQITNSQNFNKTLNLTIPFIESCLGVNKTIEYNHFAQCPECQEYSKKHGKPNVMGCAACGGSGHIQRILPHARIVQQCATCSGRGQTLVCNTCKGTGSVAQKKRISIKIDPGSIDGGIYKFDDQADFNYHLNSYGALLIQLKITPHPTMTRNGNDIFSKIKVPYLDCILGGEVEFDTIHGRDTINIPPLTDSGAVIKKSNVGINKSGSHIITVNVELPTSLTLTEKKLLNKIKNSKLEK